MVKRSLAVLSSLLVLAPSLAVAQQSKAGVVTTLEGNVTAKRVALAAPVPLKFKDEVFLQDTVTTGDRSLARMLLGGKAVVTVRERSVLTITEVPGRSTLELESGKFALAVAREKMRPGEEIQIRTPNAIAGVRGTVVITEVHRQGAQAGGGLPAVLTNFYVLRGSITAQQLDPGTRQPIGAPLQVGTLQSYSGAGSATPRVAPVPPEQVGQITSGLQPSGPKGGGEAGKEQVKAQAVQTAVTLLAALTGTNGNGGNGNGTHEFVLAPPPPPPAPSETRDVAPIVAISSDIEEAQRLAEEGRVLSTFSDFVSALGVDITLTDAPAVRFTTGFTNSSTSALLSLSGATILQTGDVSFIQVLGGADVSLAGPLASIATSTLITGGKLLEIDGGTLSSTSSLPLLGLNGSRILTGDSLLAMNGGSVSLRGPLLIDVDGTIITGAEFVRLQGGATLTSTGSEALVQLKRTAVDGLAALRMRNSSMDLAGPLVSVSNLSSAPSDTLDDGPALFVLDGSSIRSSGTGALIAFSFSDGDPDGNFLQLFNGSSLTLAGPLFTASGGKFTSGLSNDLAAFIGVLDGSVITSTSTLPLIAMSDATLDTQGPVLSVRRSPSTSSPSKIALAGPLFSGSNMSINTTSLGFGSTFGTANNCCSTFAVEQGSVLSSTTSSPLISLSSSTVTISDSQSGANFFLVVDTVTGFPTAELVAPSTVSLAGPLLSASHTTITPLFSLLSVQRSRLSSSTTSPLIELTSSTVKAGGTDISGSSTFGRMLTLLSSSTFGSAASPASITLAGPFLSSTSSTIEGTQLMGIFGGSSFSSTTTEPLMSLNGTSLKLTTKTAGATTNHGNVVDIGGPGGSDGTTFSSMSLQGPLLNVGSGSTLDLSGALALVFAGGTIAETHPSSPFVFISGGTHSIASDSGNALFRLFGRTSANTVEVVSTPGLSTTTSSLTLGTDEPLRRSGAGAFLETSGATISTKAGLTLDNALLSATAPLLALRNSSLTSAGDALNLTAKAKLTATGPLVKLDGSTLTVTNGHAIRVMNGSFLNLGGDLISILGGGHLNIANGAALFVSGGSVVKINGGLVNFHGSASQITIANNVCSGTCATAGGISFHLQNSAIAGNISITGGFKNDGSATKTIGLSDAAIILDGATSKVIISGN